MSLVVFESQKQIHCAQCRRGPLRHLVREAGVPRCLDCSDIGHLVYLPRGDAALTRRAREASSLSAVVLRFHRRRRRYERLGLLVEDAALASAERACLADAEARARRRERDRLRRAAEDIRFTAAFAAEIVRLFPGCPAGRAVAIATHASVRGSGRVGRSAEGRALDEAAVSVAVRAAVRHTETEYDALLMSGVPRFTARARLAPQIDAILDAWRALPPPATGEAPDPPGGPGAPGALAAPEDPAALGVSEGPATSGASAISGASAAPKAPGASAVPEGPEAPAASGASAVPEGPEAPAASGAAAAPEGPTARGTPAISKASAAPVASAVSEALAASEDPVAAEAPGASGVSRAGVRCSGLGVRGVSGVGGW